MLGTPLTQTAPGVVNVCYIDGTQLMTLPQKGTRHLTVDGVQYRYAVTPNDEQGFSIIAERATVPARRLVCSVNHGVAVSPSFVRRAILDAIGAGWYPPRGGSTSYNAFLPSRMRRATCTSALFAIISRSQDARNLRYAPCAPGNTTGSTWTSWTNYQCQTISRSATPARISTNWGRLRSKCGHLF